MVALLASIVTTVPMTSVNDYIESQKSWRAQREADLRAPRGWLSVAGLTWLNEGENSIGSDPGSAVLLPRGQAPSKVGTLTRSGERITLRVSDERAVLVDGKSASESELKPDSSGAPTRVQIGDLNFHIIRRADRLGVRLYNPKSRAQREFKGLNWLPINETYRVRAKFTAYPKPKQILITNILGDTEPAENPGYVEFTIGKSKRLRLEAQSEGDGLFFNFKDSTNGKTTYPAGRFLNTDGPKNGYVILDFNQAVNPPCAFTAYATCPLAPRANYLPIAIKAGELAHHAQPEGN